MGSLKVPTELIAAVAERAVTELVRCRGQSLSDVHEVAVWRFGSSGREMETPVIHTHQVSVDCLVLSVTCFGPC